MKNSTIEVGALVSTLSAAGVDRQIAGLPGMHHVDVNFVAGSATVRYDESQTSLEAIRQRVVECGYLKAHGGRAGDVMPPEVTRVTEEASLEEIATLLEKHRIKRVPVVRDGKLVGIVSRANLLQGIVARKRAPQPSVDDRKLRELVSAAIRDSGVRSDLVNPVVVDGIVDLWGMAHSEAERARSTWLQRGSAASRVSNTNSALCRPCWPPTCGCSRLWPERANQSRVVGDCAAGRHAVQRRIGPMGA